MDIDKITSHRDLVWQEFPGCFTDLGDMRVYVRESGGTLIASGTNFGEAYANAAVVAERKREARNQQVPVKANLFPWGFFATVAVAVLLAVSAIAGLVAVTIWGAMTLIHWLGRVIGGNPFALIFLAAIAGIVIAAHLSELRGRGKGGIDVVL